VLNGLLLEVAHETAGTRGVKREGVAGGFTDNKSVRFGWERGSDEGSRSTCWVGDGFGGIRSLSRRLCELVWVAAMLHVTTICTCVIFMCQSDVDVVV
jgi:hypothetical protein